MIEKFLEGAVRSINLARIRFFDFAVVEELTTLSRLSGACLGRNEAAHGDSTKMTEYLPTYPTVIT